MVPEYTCSPTGVWLPIDGAPSLSSWSRDELQWGTYLPTQATVGVPDFNQLTTVTGTVNYTSVGDGDYIADKHFTGYQNMAGISGAHWDRCLFDVSGVTTLTDRPIFNARHIDSGGNLFTDCTWWNSRADPRISAGIQGRGFTVRRGDFRGCVDGMDPAPVGSTDRADVVIEASWIRDLLYVRPYAGQADNQTHSDASQIHGGPGLWYRGNRIEGFMDTSISNWTESDFYPGKQTTSAIMVNSGGSFLPTADLHILGNWINGGGVGINMVGVPTRFLSDDGSEIRDNHFGYDFGFGANSAIYCKANHVFALTGNTRWNPADPLDWSTSFNVRTHG